MNSRLRGEELSQLARLMFNACSDKWYTAFALEVFAGIFALVLDLLALPTLLALGGALIGLALLAFAYYLRLRFEDQFHSAETMRRQSVFTEALGWPLSTVQYSEWQRKAGKRIRAKLKTTPRESDFYETQQPVGADRLAEMTAESAFYTRQLYLNRNYLGPLRVTQKREEEDDHTELPAKPTTEEDLVCARSTNSHEYG